MSAITIPLAEERLAQLRVLAALSGLTPEEDLKRRGEFHKATAYVLKKNAELYRRLA